jgi:hypothetical protein
VTKASTVDSSAVYCSDCCVALALSRYVNENTTLSGIYTCEKALHVAAVASDGDLKIWEDFY